MKYDMHIQRDGRTDSWTEKWLDKYNVIDKNCGEKVTGFQKIFKRN